MEKPAIKLDVPGPGANLLMLRGVLAILLTVGFYGLALGIAGMLLFLIYAEFAYVGRVNLRLTFFALVAAGTILWAIFPRVDRFTAPGARLAPQEQLRLFDLIRQIAQKTGQKMPAEVYLIADVNAFVAERGGFLGIGRRRVMGIGLPLLQSLSVGQLTAVITHEFGHFYGGDTSIGPWIYKTREAIIRTVASLRSNSFIQAPFRWYGEMFLRITQTISRRQELVADALAANIAGANMMIESLKSVRGLAPAFSAYWEKEIIPLFGRGFYPPIGAGFQQFTHNKQIAEAITNIVSEDLQHGKSSPYDSHPSLNERIEALKCCAGLTALADNSPAIDLLANSSKLEKEMILALYGERAGQLQPVQWEEIAETVYLKNWQEITSKHQSALANATLRNLAEQTTPGSPLVKAIGVSSNQPVNLETLQSAAQSVLSMAVGVSLARQGWKVTTQPGSNFTLVKDGSEVDLFETVRKNVHGEIDDVQWKQFWESRGVDIDAPLLAA